jgi:kynurenine formamidase
VPASSLTTAAGYSDLGAEYFPPIIMRGILLDVAGSKGQDQLPDLYEISADDLRRCEQRQGVAIAPETVVLVRSGFENYWQADPARYMGQGAGPGPEAARYLAAQGAIATGSDTANYELLAFPNLPVHHYLLYERGIFIMENLRLNELATANAYEFLFIALPIAFGGATGSSIHPIAIT